MIQTYGKRNMIANEYYTIKEYFKPEQKIAGLWNAVGCELYTPKVKRWKMGVVGLFTAVCLVTPFTNMLIPFSMRWMLK